MKEKLIKEISTSCEMTIRKFWEQNAENDDYGDYDKKVLNNPLHYYFLDFDDIPKDKVKELIYHTEKNNEELECVMAEDDGDIWVRNGLGFFEYYDDNYTMGELFDDIYEQCLLYVNNNNDDELLLF